MKPARNRPGADFPHGAFQAAGVDEIAFLHGPLKQDDQPADDVAGDVLKTEADADADDAGEERERPKPDPDEFERQGETGEEDQIADDDPHRVPEAVGPIEVGATGRSPLQRTAIVRDIARRNRMGRMGGHAEPRPRHRRCHRNRRGRACLAPNTRRPLPGNRGRSKQRPYEHVIRDHDDPHRNRRGRACPAPNCDERRSYRETGASAASCGAVGAVSEEGTPVVCDLGTRVVKLRLPAAAVDVADAQVYCNGANVSLRARIPPAWRAGDDLIATKQTKAYDEAVRLLNDLRDLAARGQLPDFALRLPALCEANARKPGLLTRPQRARL